MIYQFFVGFTPFKGRTSFLTFQNIVKGQYAIPKGIPVDA